jgi:hypothetical protein
MAARHGTRHRYNDGCHCDDCTAANTAYQQRYRHRPTAVGEEVTRCFLTGPGPVECGVEAEIAGLAEPRPGLAQVALALARVMDNPRSIRNPRLPRCWPRCWTRCTRGRRVVVGAAWRWSSR